MNVFFVEHMVNSEFVNAYQSYFWIMLLVLSHSCNIDI